MRILYVEDNPELRETIGMLMEGDGRTITTCATAEEALELERASGGSFDLLVSDVSLPGMSGTDLARQVLASEPDRWVVLCSGYDLGSHPSAWGPHVRTLMKPFELEDLEAMLADVQACLDAAPAGR